MKPRPINITITLLGILFLHSCHDCTITVIEEPELFDCPALNLNIGEMCDDGNPDTQNDIVTEDCLCVGTIGVDCPNLGLNIGDVCDDGNPETTNDVVDANCNCTGEPVNTCEGELFVMRAQVVNNSLGNLFLERSTQAPLDQVSFSTLEAITGSAIQAGAAFPFQFSALNAPQQRYYYGFQYGNSGLLNPLLLASTNGLFSPGYLLSELPYAAPVYHNGELYAINVVFDASTVNYEIQRVDLSDGQPSVIFSGSVAVNSQVVNPVFFSASNGDNKVFFLAGTSLFEYDVNVNAVTHVLLETDPNPDMPVVYTGLEYRASTNELLALRHQAIGTEIQTTLVTISQDGTFSQNPLQSINGYTFFQDAGVLHSTAYDACEDNYYITTPVALEQEVFETYLIEINLQTETIDDQVFDDFLFGVEIQSL